MAEEPALNQEQYYHCSLQKGRCYCFQKRNARCRGGGGSGAAGGGGSRTLVVVRGPKQWVFYLSSNLRLF